MTSLQMWGLLISATPLNAMDILTFHKLTRPHYEGGLNIDCRPRGEFLVEVRRSDGTIRRPFGDFLIQNTFLNQWRDGQLGGTANTGSGSNATSGFGWGNNSASQAPYSWLDLFYGSLTSLAVGSGSTAATASDTALATQVRTDSTPYASGNAVTWSQSSGDVVYTIKEAFPAETGSVTYREAGIRLFGSNINGIGATSAARLINRVVFPADVTLSSGESLILTIAVTVPTLAKTGGKTITISAQNGMNISGALRVTGTEARIVGGTVTGAGVATVDSNHVTLFSPNKSTQAILSTLTAFDTANTNPTWGTTGVLQGVWQSYTNGNYYRDLGFTWGSGTPASNTDFRSILIRSGSVTNSGGYHLLLDNQQTKASTGTLSFSLRFSV